jgi:hypothetical protein
MRPEYRNPVVSYSDGEQTSGWVFIVLLVVGIPWAIWTIVALLGSGASPIVPFNLVVGWFLILALAYLGLHGSRGASWSSVPVLLTIEALVTFIGVPLWRFLENDDQIDSGYARAMLLVLIGFASLWIGSLMVMKESTLQFSPAATSTSMRVTVMSGSMLALGVGENLALWKAGLFSYTADVGLREANVGIMQWLGFLSGLLNGALVVSAIEVIGKRSTQVPIRLIFWASFTLSVGFGLISGMKSGPMYPLLYVLLVYGVSRKQMPKTALLLPALVVVLIYPFVNAYRENMNHGYRAQMNTIGGSEAVLEKSFSDAFLGVGSTSSSAAKGYSDAATGRLSYLSYVRDIIKLPAPSMLRGDESVWLAPLYSLVPRFFWKEKPVLNKGQRLSFILGHGMESSSAPTLIGDLYSTYGTYGLVAGMLAWGICLQLYMNRIGGKPLSEVTLFIYTSMLLRLINLEEDFVATVAGTVQVSIEVALMAYIIYGRSASSLQPARMPTRI